MNEFIDPALLTLSDCECCEGTTVQTPIEVFNRPGLNAIAYRVGTHPQFKQSLLADLSESQSSPLTNLTTRADDDFTIALLDAWATVADVLTFYQERIASESYLRTATERLSILQLARLIGYELNPGVAASTYLAFTVEDAIGSPRTTTIDIGVKVQSVPGHGQQPQTFETIEKIEARAEWNAIKPLLTKPQVLSPDTQDIWFKGINLNLKQGDGLLLIQDSAKTFRRIQKVKIDNAAQQTVVSLEKVKIDNAAQQTVVPLEMVSERSSTAASLAPLLVGAEYIYTQQALNNTTIRNLILNQTHEQRNLETFIRFQGWDASQVERVISAIVNQPSSSSETKVYVFRTVAALFGYNAPQQTLYQSNGTPQIEGGTLKQQDWPLHEDPSKVSLDNAYSGITTGSHITILKSDGVPHIYSVTAVAISPRTDYGISGKTSILTLESSWWNNLNWSDIRNTTVYAQSEKLELVDQPDSDPVGGNTITLDRYYLGLSVGQNIILTGKRTDLADTESEVGTIADIKTPGDGYPEITLVNGLQNQYQRDSVTINANVARSTHGETVQEVLGSGDASLAYQTFTLLQPPLTYVTAPNSSGSTSTLQVRVNDILWQEVRNLYQQGQKDRIYITRTSDNGKTTIEFGDGNTGARLPTGQENIKATYRKGIGLDGQVQANQLSLLLTRPLGVKAVTNPFNATGAADPEVLDQARRNSPLTVLTLDRIVSLQDYEDFSRTFAGIAKAQAIWTWNGQVRGVFITVAGPNGAEVPSNSALYKNLVSAIQQAGDPYIPVQVQSYQRAFFRIGASIKIDPAYLPDKVVTDVQQSLQTQFGFDARDFGQGVALSEVIAVIQSVSGVVAVDISQFYRFNPNYNIIIYQPQTLPARLGAAAPQAGASGTVTAAELLLLDTVNSNDIGVMT
jgi:hypothetical protein